MKLRLLLMLFAAICLSTSCAYTRNVAITEDFEKSTKNFNKLLRWREIETAGMTYMDKDLKDAFLEDASRLKKRDVTVADYRIITRDFDVEKRKGELVVEFDYFIMPSNRLKTITYRQIWLYKGEEGKESWRVTTPLPKFE